MQKGTESNNVVVKSDADITPAEIDEELDNILKNGITQKPKFF